MGSTPTHSTSPSPRPTQSPSTTEQFHGTFERPPNDLQTCERWGAGRLTGAGRLEAGHGRGGGSRLGHRLRSAGGTPTPLPPYVRLLCVLKIRWETTTGAGLPAAGFRPPAARKWPALPPLTFATRMVATLPRPSPRGGTLDLNTPMGVLRPRVPPGLGWDAAHSPAPLLVTCPPARLPVVHIFAVYWGPPDLSPPTDTAREYCVNFELISQENVAGDFV